MSLVLFLSYSHRDTDLRDALLDQLGVLEVEGLIGIAVDDRIPVGSDWLDRLNESLLEADAAILLVTSSFLTSDFIRDTEVPELLRRRKNGGLTVIPVIAKPCRWQDVAWLARLQVWNRGKVVWDGNAAETERTLSTIAKDVATLARSGSRATTRTVAAANAIDYTVDESLRSASQVTLPHVVHTLVTAIQHGAPVYNAGRFQECAAIYQHAARKALSQIHAALASTSNPMMLGPRRPMDPGRSASGMSTGSGGRRSQSMPGSPRAPMTTLTSPVPLDPSTRALLAACRVDLRETLGNVELLGSHAADDAAWLLRDCFDRILTFQSWVEPPSELRRIPAVTLQAYGQALGLSDGNGDPGDAPDVSR
jgi:hypothetical protein